jgi:hypothetical protein
VSSPDIADEFAEICALFCCGFAVSLSPEPGLPGAGGETCEALLTEIAAIEAQRTYIDRLVAFARTVPDYDEVLGAATVLIPEHVADFLKSSPNGPAVGYFLAKNLHRCRRITWMTPARAIHALKRLEAKLQAPRLALVHNVDAIADQDRPTPRN